MGRGFFVVPLPKRADTRLTLPQGEGKIFFADRDEAIEDSTMAKLRNVHPGDVLKLEFLQPLGITAYRLAKDIGVAQTRIAEILKRRRAITAETALRLARYFNTTPQFWLGLQADYDLEAVDGAIIRAVKKIPTAALAQAGL